MDKLHNLSGHNLIATDGIPALFADLLKVQPGCIVRIWQTFTRCGVCEVKDLKIANKISLKYDI